MVAVAALLLLFGQPPGWTPLDISGWTAMVWRGGEAATAFNAGLTLICDPPEYASGLRVYVTGLPVLPVGPAETQYRLGDEPAATGVWEVDSGTESASVIVPDDLVEAVLLAGRIEVRVHYQVLVHEWENGAAVYRVMSKCAGW